MFTEAQYKDLALFNSFKAMQLELLAAQQGQLAQQLGQRVEELTKERDELTAKLIAELAKPIEDARATVFAPRMPD